MRAGVQWQRCFAAFALTICFSTFAPPFQAAPLIAPPRQTNGSQSGTAPQLVPRSQEERERRYQDAQRIILHAQVFDPAGKPVTSLEEKDFTVLVDEKSRKIAQFQSIQNESSVSPAYVILVLDGVNNSSGRLRHFRQGIEDFLNSGSGPLAQQMSIAIVSDSGASISPPSQDRSMVMAEVKAPQIPEGAGDCADSANTDSRYLPSRAEMNPIDPNPQLDCLNHRFNASIRALSSLASRQSNEPARVLLIWMGDGWPLLSVGNFKPDTPSIKQGFFRDLVTISNGLMEQHATLDAIASPDVEALRAHDKAIFDGVPNEKEVTAASLSLHALSHQSGGQVLKSTKDIAGEISNCIADAASYYVLGFDSPPGGVTEEYHSIKVKVGDPDLQVRTSTVYYAEE
jgi:VWFA-related protein